MLHIFVSLFILVVPRVEELFISANGTAGEVVIFSCTFSGFPQPEIKWYKNGQPLELDSHHVSVTNSPPGEQVEVANTTSTLQISGLVLSDRGNYSCFTFYISPNVWMLESKQLDFIVLCKFSRRAKFSNSFIETATVRNN